MNSPKKLMTTLSVMALALFLPACSESGMKAKNQEKAEVPAGTQLYVRVNQNMPSSDKGWKSGDEFQGTLARSLEVAGRVIAPEGTIVKGDITDKLDTDNTGMMARDNRTGAPTSPNAPTGDATMSTSRADNNRMGLELNKIVLNGDEYKIETHAVPIPESMGPQSEGANAGYGKSTPGTERSNRKMDKSDRESMAKSEIAGQEFVFTLKDKTDLPATTNNMKTE